jgi:hypothetical protein
LITMDGVSGMNVDMPYLRVLFIDLIHEYIYWHDIHPQSVSVETLPPLSDRSGMWRRRE